MTILISFFRKHTILSIVIGFQLFRLCLLPFMGLMPQDAYYHFYGEHLALSYFDHPGMIGYILALFTSLFGKTVFVVKFADFFITSLTLISFYKLATLFLSRKRAKNALLLFTTTVCVSILSFNSTPDVPLILFWTLSLTALYKAIFENKKKYWVLGGFAMGLAFDSKYTGLFLQIGLLGFLFFSKEKRKLLTTAWPWVALLVSVVTTLPVWYWNVQNEFASFLFQSSNRTENIAKFQFRPDYFFGAIGHQFVLIGPSLFALFLKIVYKYTKKVVVAWQFPHGKTLFLLAFFIPTFVGFLALTPVYWVKLNWLMPSYVTGIVLASYFFSKKMTKAHVFISALFHIAISVQILFYIVPMKTDDTWLGWEALTKQTEKIQSNYPNTFIFSADSYKTTACMNFYSTQKIYAQNIIGEHGLHFDYIGDDLSLLAGKNALFIDSDKRFKDAEKKGALPKDHLNDYFSKITELKPIFIKKNGKNIRKFWIYYCENYQPKK
jgi:hypothetical protein